MCPSNEKRLVNILRAEENRVYCKDEGGMLGLKWMFSRKTLQDKAPVELLLVTEAKGKPGIISFFLIHIFRTNSHKENPIEMFIWRYFKMLIPKLYIGSACISSLWK